MVLHSLVRMFTVLTLCLSLAVPAFPQSGYGPSKGEVVALIVAAVVVIGGVGYLIFRVAHKHASIEGCVMSDENGLRLTNEKDKKTYVLTDGSAVLQPRRRVALSGKKMKDSTGKLTFQVQKLSKDYGECQPAASGI